MDWYIDLSDGRRRSWQLGFTKSANIDWCNEYQRTGRNTGLCDLPKVGACSVASGVGLQSCTKWWWACDEGWWLVAVLKTSLRVNNVDVHPRRCQVLQSPKSAKENRKRAPKQCRAMVLSKRCMFIINNPAVRKFAGRTTRHCRWVDGNKWWTYFPYYFLVFRRLSYEGLEWT